MTEYVWCDDNNCIDCPILEVEQGADDTDNTNVKDDKSGIGEGGMTPTAPRGQ